VPASCAPRTGWRRPSPTPGRSPGCCPRWPGRPAWTTEELLGLLRNEGKDPVLYVVGRKGETYYRFRDREFAESWTGFSEQPGYEDAQAVGSTLIEAFTAGEDDQDGGAGADGILGVDELHIVYTEFRSLLSQVPVAKRMAPLVVEEVDEFRDERDQPERTSEVPTSYEFEPSAEALLDALLPKYVTTRIYAAMLEAAASESASRRRAMKSASDNAEELAKNLSRQANQARQAEITQEISEIVGGADALVSAGSDD
jgi:F-type H+-transporting ATPase subunit gamma